MILIIIASTVAAFVLGFYIGNVRGFRSGIELAVDAILNEEEKEMRKAFDSDGEWRETP